MEGELDKDSVVAFFATVQIWANSVLKEYIIKGFAMDDERLKGNDGGNYWKELLGRKIA